MQLGVRYGTRRSSEGEGEKIIGCGFEGAFFFCRRDDVYDVSVGFFPKEGDSEGIVFRAGRQEREKKKSFCEIIITGGWTMDDGRFKIDHPPSKYNASF